MRAAVGARAWAVELTEHRGRVTARGWPLGLCALNVARPCGSTAVLETRVASGDLRTQSLLQSRSHVLVQAVTAFFIHVFIPEYGCRPAIRYDDTHPPTEKGRRGVGRGGGGWSTVLAARRMNVFHMLSVSSNPVPPNHKPCRRCWVMERNCPPGRCRCRRSLSFRRTSRHRWSYLTLRGSLHALT